MGKVWEAQLARRAATGPSTNNPDAFVFASIGNTMLDSPELEKQVRRPHTQYLRAEIKLVSWWRPGAPGRLCSRGRSLEARSLQNITGGRRRLHQHTSWRLRAQCPPPPATSSTCRCSFSPPSLRCSSLTSCQPFIVLIINPSLGSSGPSPLWPHTPL